MVLQIHYLCIFSDSVMYINLRVWCVQMDTAHGKHHLVKMFKHHMHGVQIIVCLSINPNFMAMVTGHRRTRAYRHRFRLIDNAMCPCNKEDQTVDHLIYQCTLLHTNTELLRVNIQQSGNWPAGKLELITKHLKSFLTFTKSINFDEL